MQIFDKVAVTVVTIMFATIPVILVGGIVAKLIGY